jgi:hypothetical protein
VIATWCAPVRRWKRWLWRLEALVQGVQSM